MRRTVRFAITMGCLALSCTARPGLPLLLAVEADHVDGFASPCIIQAEPPLGVKCLGQCRPSKDHGQAYDPETGVFHIEFAEFESGFEVVKVANEKTRPVVFHLTGLPDLYGFEGLPLTLAVDGKNYLIDMERDEPVSPNYNVIRDDTLFRVKRKFVTEYTYERPCRMIEVTVEFTETGRLLLKPGARIFCIIRHYW